MSILRNPYAAYRSQTLASVLTAVALLGATGIMQGCSGEDDVNCSTGVGLDAYNTGNGEGANAGAVAGGPTVLTYDRGKQDGYNGGYQRGYNIGYDSSEGYSKGYVAGKNTGISIGRNDIYACSEGSVTGAEDGYNDGLEDGQHYGYADGKIEGWDKGFIAGQFSSCIPGAGASKTEKTQNVCKDRGYNAGYSTAFATAKANNTVYANGLKDGDTLGYAEGLNPGVSQGYADGLNAGSIDGVTQGQQEAYASCYNASYENGTQDRYGVITGGKVNGYDEGYYDLVYGLGMLPTPPQIDNGSGGLGDGFYDGYLDGQLLICGEFSAGAAAATPAKLTRRYGTGSAANFAAGKLMSWAQVSQTGAIMDVFADKRSSFMTSKQNAELSTKLNDLRIELRAKAGLGL